MAGVSFTSINTGLPPNIIEKVMEAEAMPLKNLEVRKAKSEEKLKLVSDLEQRVSSISGTLGELAGTRGFNDYQLTSSSPGVISGVADPGLNGSGSWNIEVVQIAEKASAITNGFPDKDVTEVGVGYLTFKTPEGKKEIYIDGKNNTLQSVAAKINSASMGIKATIINDRKDKEAPYKLVLSSDLVGQDNQIEYPKLYFLDGDQDFYFEESKAAKNGVIKVDGFEMEISDNKVTDVIPGVTLEIHQADPGKVVNLSVKENQEAVSGKVEEFVKAANSVLSFIQQQNKLDKNTDTSKTLGGDGILRNIESRMRRMIMDPQYGVGSGITMLSQLGIRFNRSGMLDFDKEKFRGTLAKQPKDVQAFFSGDGIFTGFVNSVKRELGGVLNQSFGPMANRKRGLQDSINSIENQIERKNKQLVKKEEQLRRQFSKLEETMSKLKSQGAAVGGMGGGGTQFGGMSVGGGA